MNCGQDHGWYEIPVPWKLPEPTPRLVAPCATGILHGVCLI